MHARGWLGEGQVERQVGDVRGRLFVPSPRGRSYAEINAWLMDRCIEDAKKRPHPTIPGKTVWQVFEEERPFLMAYRGPFDGFHATEVAVSKTWAGDAEQHRARIALARDPGRGVDARQHHRLGMGARRQPARDGFFKRIGDGLRPRARPGPRTPGIALQLEGLDQRRQRHLRRDARRARGRGSRPPEIRVRARRVPRRR